MSRHQQAFRPPTRFEPPSGVGLVNADKMAVAPVLNGQAPPLPALDTPPAFVPPARLSGWFSTPEKIDIAVRGQVLGFYPHQRYFADPPLYTALMATDKRDLLKWED